MFKREIDFKLKCCFGCLGTMYNEIYMLEYIYILNSLDMTSIPYTWCRSSSSWRQHERSPFNPSKTLARKKRSRRNACWCNLGTRAKHVTIYGDCGGASLDCALRIMIFALRSHLDAPSCFGTRWKNYRWYGFIWVSDNKCFVNIRGVRKKCCRFCFWKIDWA